MSEIDTRDALLTIAIQDLRDAHTRVVDRLPGLSSSVSDADLCDLLHRATDTSREACDVLVETGCGEGGDPNIWMKGVLDDADRDAETVARGRVAGYGADRRDPQGQGGGDRLLRDRDNTGRRR